MDSFEGSVTAVSDPVAGSDLSLGSGPGMSVGGPGSPDPTGGVAASSESASVDLSSMTIDEAQIAAISAASGVLVGAASMLTAAAVVGDLPGVGSVIVAAGATVGTILGLAGQAAIGFGQSRAGEVLAADPRAVLGLYTSDAQVTGVVLDAGVFDVHSGSWWAVVAS